MFEVRLSLTFCFPEMITMRYSLIHTSEGRARAARPFDC